MQADAFKASDPLTSNEAKLWQAVILQAVHDAVSSVRIRDKSQMRKAIMIRDECRDWLLKGSKDFRLVCTLAGLDPDDVRDMAQSLSRKDWPRLLKIGRPIRGDIGG